jgi:hypothetical protein
MNVAQHAEQILAAWKRADAVSFESELNRAMSSCQHAAPANHLELEQREVLESVVERLRLIRPARGLAAAPAANGSPQSLNAGFTLLEHLCHRAAA